MNYLIETIFVGFYTMILYFILNLFKLHYNLLLFLLGFLKHFLGYYIGVQDVYCQLYNPRTKSNNNFFMVFAESIGEGTLFTLLGFLLLKIKLNKNIIPFIIGIILHITFELAGIHSFFLEKRCKVI